MAKERVYYGNNINLSHSANTVPNIYVNVGG